MLKRILELVLLLLVVGGAVLWLLVSKPGESQVVSQTFTFTWPGDDGMTGTASSLELRWSTAAIVGTDTLSWWNAATRWAGAYPVPKVAGTPDSVIVTGLPNDTVVYAVAKACDEVPNCSGFSNVAVGKTKDFVPPAPPQNLRFGLWFRPSEAMAAELSSPAVIRDLRMGPLDRAYPRVV